MSTMIEKVAKAILHEIREGGAFVNTNDDDLRYLVLVDGDVDMLAVARSAIEAMREPTEGMVHAGYAVGLANDTQAIYEAMIDAALKEGQ